jgi:hypothetical protein
LECGNFFGLIGNRDPLSPVDQRNGAPETDDEDSLMGLLGGDKLSMKHADLMMKNMIVHKKKRKEYQVNAHY